VRQPTILFAILIAASLQPILFEFFLNDIWSCYINTVLLVGFFYLATKDTKPIDRSLVVEFVSHYASQTCFRSRLVSMVYPTIAIAVWATVLSL